MGRSLYYTNSMLPTMKHFLPCSSLAFLWVPLALFGGNALAQNVGIGEAAPAARLDIQAADNVTDVFRIDDSGGTPLFHIGAAGDIYLGGNAGVAGEAIFSNGPGAPAAWGTVPSPLVGGIPTRVAFFTSPTSLGHNADFYWDDVNLHLGIGNGAPNYTLHVTGDIRFEGDFVNQEMTTAGNAFSFAPYQLIPVIGTTPINNTTVSIAINDGDGGPNNSGVLIDATITAGNGNISNNGYGNGAQCILCTTLQRDTDPAFSAPVGLQTHCTGTTFIRTGNGNLQIADSGGFSYADLGLTNGNTYYYRLVGFTGTNYVPTGNQGILAATVTLTQIKR